MLFFSLSKAFALPLTVLTSHIFILASMGQGCSQNTKLKMLYFVSGCLCNSAAAEVASAVACGLDDEKQVKMHYVTFEENSG